MIIDFLKNLTAEQWAIIGGVIVMLLQGSGKLNVVDLLKKILSIFVAKKDEPGKDDDHDDHVDDDHDHDKDDDHANHTLADIVCKWDCLHKCCEHHELDEACKKLDEVFPLLHKAHKRN